MASSRLLRTILYSELVNSKRHCGLSKRRFRDQLKFSLLQARIDTNTWETVAADHPSWQRAFRFGCSRKTEEVIERGQRKARQLQPRPSSALPCDQCPRIYQVQALGKHRLNRTCTHVVSTTTTN